MTDTWPGAYGLRVRGLPGAEAWMQAQPVGAPTLTVRVRVGDAGDLPSSYDADSADLRLLGGGRLLARRGTGTVDYVLPKTPPDEDLLHPYLAPAAALVWRWAGCETVHAGAFAGGGGAVLVLGGKEAGKSTTLAWLSDAGVTVLADDLAVIDGDEVLAGPRTIDLRMSSAVRSGARPVRQGERARVTLAPAPARLKVAGVAVLEWGGQVRLEPVALDRRWAVVAPQRSFPHLPANAVSLLELVAVPTFRVARPPGVRSLQEVGQALTEAFGRPAPSSPRLPATRREGA